MATSHLTATVDAAVLQQFEDARSAKGEKRSHAVEQAIRLYLRAYNDALIAEGVRASSDEDRAIAKSARRKSGRAIAKNL